MEGRSILGLLQGGQNPPNQQQTQTQTQPQNQQYSQQSQQPQQQQQQQQQQQPQQHQQFPPPQGMMHDPSEMQHQRPFYGNMGPMRPPPHMAHMGPHMGQMMPGFGFNPEMDQQMLMMQQGPRGHMMGPPPPFPPGGFGMAMGMGQLHHPPEGFNQVPSPQQRPQSQSNNLASLLLSLNQPSVVSPPITPSASTPGPSAAPPALAAISTSASQQDLQASTDSLKLALFGPPKTDSGNANSNANAALAQPTPRQEDNNLLAMLNRSSNTSSPAHSGQGNESRPPISSAGSKDIVRESSPLAQTNNHSHTKVTSGSEIAAPAESSMSSATSTATAAATTTKSKFTYVNPFHSFSSSPTTPSGPLSNSGSSPVAARSGTPLAQAQPQSPLYHNPATLPPVKRTLSSTSLNARRDTPPQVEPVASNTGRSQEHGQRRYQVDQLLPPHASWNHRVQKLAKGSSSYPDGVYLSKTNGDTIYYDTGLDNADAIFSEDLETIPITLIPTDVEYNHGKLVAVSKGYISYAAKGGKIRVIEQAHGHRTLLRGHGDQVIDMAFSAERMENDESTQLLVSLGKDSRLIIWKLSEADQDSTDIAQTKVIEVVGEPASDKPRYNRVAWNPVNPSILALVNNDDFTVMVVDIQRAWENATSSIVSEAYLLEYAYVLDSPHTQTINDITFSADGTMILTASDDGLVQLWNVGPSSATNQKILVPHGGLSVTNALFVDSPDSPVAQCIVTACRRGTELTLWSASGAEIFDQFTFKEPPNTARRSSLGKSAARLHDMRMFNFIGFDPETQSLVLANSSRLSLFGIKIKVESTKPISAKSQSDYDGSTERPTLAKFDFLIEYPMPQPVISFVVMPDSSLENNGFSVYCIQAKAVQQYIIKGLEPHDKEKCQTFVSAPLPTKPTEPKAQQSQQTPPQPQQPKNRVPPISRTASNTSTKETADERADDKDGSPAVKDSEGVLTPSLECLENRDSDKPIKLHGAVINGAIAKLKERKRNSNPTSDASSVAGSELSDRRESIKPTTASGRQGGRKNSQDTGSLSTPRAVSPMAANPSTRLRTVGEKVLEQKAAPGKGRHGAKGGDQSETSDQQPQQQHQKSGQSMSLPNDSVMLQALLQTMEEQMSARLEAKMTLELERHHRKLEEDHLTRQEVVLKMISQTLAKNTELLLEQTVRNEIQASVVPALSKIIGSTVERQLSRAISDNITKALPVAVESAVSANVERVMDSTSFLSKVTNQVATSIRPAIEESFKDSFTKVLIPSYQKATQAMFQQMTTAFQEGIQDLGAANTKEQGVLEAVHNSVKLMSANVDVIQTNLAQVAQAQTQMELAHTQQAQMQMQYQQQASMQLQQQQQLQQHASQYSQSGRAMSMSHSSTQGGGFGGAESTSSSRRESMMNVPAESKQIQEVKASIVQLFAYGDYENGFTQALSTNDSNVVHWACTQVSPMTVFQFSAGQNGGVNGANIGATNDNEALSQAVLLALVHHLANDQLSQHLNTRLGWLQECLFRLRPKDPMVVDHYGRIASKVRRRLELTYQEMLTKKYNNEPSPHLQNLEMMLRFLPSE